MGSLAPAGLAASRLVGAAIGTITNGITAVIGNVTGQKLAKPKGGINWKVARMNGYVAAGGAAGAAFAETTMAITGAGIWTQALVGQAARATLNVCLYVSGFFD